MMKRYPQYKGIGVEWLGEVPAHWGVVPLKYLVSMRSGGTPDKNNPIYWGGEIPWASAKDLKVAELHDTTDHITEAAVDGGAASLIPVESLLVVVRGMILARTFPVAVAKVPMAINQDLKAVIPRENIRPEFLAWLLRGSETESLSRLDEAGHGTKALRMDSWGAMRLPVPSLDEQACISDFLSRETAKIDTLIAEQQKLIALLAEKRQATISHAVTRGLDPHVPMKDSGVAWLGEVPAHWSLRRLKQIVRSGVSVSYGIVQPGEPLEEGVPFVQTSNMSDASFAPEQLQRTAPEIAAAYPRSQLSGGEVILGIRASIGAAYVVPEYLRGANLSRGIARIECGDEIESEYLVYVLRSHQTAHYWGLAKQGSTFNEVSIETVRELSFAVPPLVEQHAISEFIRVNLSKLSNLIQDATHAVELFRERRSALITAAVTGQIDVRAD